MFEIAALASPLIKHGDILPGEGNAREPWHHILGAALYLCRSFAPAVVVGQGVRLVSTLVQQRQRQSEEQKANEGNTEGEQCM